MIEDTLTDCTGSAKLNQYTSCIHVKPWIWALNLKPVESIEVRGRTMQYAQILPERSE